MKRSECFKIGYVLKPHGLKGEVTVSIDPDAPDFSSLESVFIETENSLEPFFITGAAVRADKAFLKFEDVDSPEQAQAICKSAVYLPKSLRPRSGKDQFYDDEIVGFEVSDTRFGSLGSVSEVIAAGPNKLLSVHNNGKEILIPVNSPFIQEINKSKKQITVSLPEGYLDI